MAVERFATTKDTLYKIVYTALNIFEVCLAILLDLYRYANTAIARHTTKPGTNRVTPNQGRLRVGKTKLSLRIESYT